MRGILRVVFYSKVMFLISREQENTIKTQQTIISTLKERLKTKEKGTRRGGESEASCSKCASHRITETALGSASCYSSNDEKRRMHWASTSGSEMASCSSAPVPPKRMLRKHTCDEVRYFSAHVSRLV